MQSKTNSERKFYIENRDKMWNILKLLSERPEGAVMKKDNYEVLMIWYKVALKKLIKKDIDFLNKVELLWGSNRFKEIVDLFSLLEPPKDKEVKIKKATMKK